MLINFTKFFTHHILYLIVLLTLQSINLCAMEQASTKPKTLLEYCNIGDLNLSCHKDLKTMIVKKAVGVGGWWYPTTLQQRGFTASVAVCPEKNMVVTGGETESLGLGIVRFFDQSTEFRTHSCVVRTHESRDDTVVKVAYCPKKTRFAYALQHRVFVTDREMAINTKDIINNPLHQVPGYISSVLLNAKNDQVIVVSSDLSERGRRKDSIYALNAISGTLIKQISTRYYPYAHKGNPVALHPQGHMFVMAFNNKVNFWNDEWKQYTQLVSQSPACCIEFDQQGGLLAFAGIDGQVHLYNNSHIGSVVDEPDHSFKLKPLEGKEDFHELCDMKFHPTKKLLALALCTGDVLLTDFSGMVTRRMDKYGLLREIAFSQDGTRLYAVGGSQSPKLGTKDNGVIVWHEHKNVTLAQVALRGLLKRHIAHCLALCVDTETSDLTTDKLIPWMTDRFNIQEDDLKSTWGSLPSALQESIIKTLVQRGKFAQHIEHKYHGSIFAKES